MLRLISVFLALSITLVAPAQFGYHFSVKQESYQPLTDSISINNGNLWDEEIYKVPVGFSFVLDGDTIDSCYIAGPTALFNDTIGPTLSVFWTLFADFYDRGTNKGGISQSPLSYVTTGLAGSRVCKIEISNAGFWDEYNLYNTSNDFVNLQIWLYEGSNVVELRYGQSKISYPADYFIFYSDPLAALVRMSVEGDSIRAMYYLHGDPANPWVDSVFNEETNTLLLPHALDSMPAAGTVYRFEPLPNSVADVKANGTAQIYPTICTDKLLLQCEKDNVRYKVYSVTGVDTGVEGKTFPGLTTIYLHTLPSGVYILSIQDNSEKKATTFIKQ